MHHRLVIVIVKNANQRDNIRGDRQGVRKHVASQPLRPALHPLDGKALRSERGDIRQIKHRGTQIRKPTQRLAGEDTAAAADIGQEQSRRPHRGYSWARTSSATKDWERAISSL
jgi:hypothetical protein